MKVNLAKDWFDPNGALHRSRHNPVTISDSLRDRLPKGAKIIDKVIPKVKEEQTSTLRDFDETRTAAKLLDKKIAEAK